MTDSEPRREWAEVRVADDLSVMTFATRWSAGEAHYLYHEVFTHDDYLVGLPQLRHDCVVIDAGANIGMFSLRIARATPGARLVAVEPAPDTCALLRRNLADAGVGRVEVVEAALGALPGRMTLTVFRHLPANSTGRPHEKPASWVASTRATESDPELAEELLSTDRVEVDVVRLSDLLPADAAIIDLLKVDVEGGELDVLRGVDAADWPRIAQVVAEVHDVGGRLEAVLALLRGRGFSCSVRLPAMMPAELDHYLVTARRQRRVRLP